MIELHTGDCRDVLPLLEAGRFDACITDPPYHLTQNSRGGHARTNNPNMPHGRHCIGDKGFMGKVWDGGDVAFDPATWRAVFRVLKPGAHLLAFGGTRTYHRMTCAIEDAGFEIRDCIAWLYGSGFPKSLDVSKAIDKAAGEIGQWRQMDHPGRPGSRTRGNTSIIGQTNHCTDANPHGLRSIYEPASEAAGEWQGWGTALKPALEPIVVARKPLVGTVAENVLAHRTGALNVDACRVSAPDGVPLFSSRGESRSVALGDGLNGSNRTGEFGAGRWPANVIHDGSDEVVALFPAEAGSERDRVGAFHSDSGSAARFFYTAKVSASERGRNNSHPTVKPLDLMRYLCRLVMPAGATLIDPFCGSGSTAIAAAQLDMHAVCIDLEAAHVEIAANRVREKLGMFVDVQRHAIVSGVA